MIAIGPTFRNREAIMAAPNKIQLFQSVKFSRIISNLGSENIGIPDQEV